MQTLYVAFFLSADRVLKDWSKKDVNQDVFANEAFDRPGFHSVVR